MLLSQMFWKFETSYQFSFCCWRNSRLHNLVSRSSNNKSNSQPSNVGNYHIQIAYDVKDILIHQLLHKWKTSVDLVQSEHVQRHYTLSEQRLLITRPEIVVEKISCGWYEINTEVWIFRTVRLTMWNLQGFQFPLIFGPLIDPAKWVS